MQEVKIIALSGYIRAGKDYIAKLAEKQFGYKHLKLAGLVKLNYCLIKGISMEQLEERKYKEIARPYLIALSEKMKEVDTFVHCDYVYNQILSGLPEKTKIIISDLRFPYESIYFGKFDRCSKHTCDIDAKSIFGAEVKYQSIYVESDLADKSSKAESESYYESYLKPNSNGVIFNGTNERYDRDGSTLVNQLVKYI